MSLARTVRIIREAGLARFWRNLNVLGDAKGGHLVGQDSMGNKYYEDPTEIPGRHRWVEFIHADFNASQSDPAWNAWLKHIQSEPPSTNPRMQHKHTWESAPQENLTGTRGAFKTYSTVKRKVNPWQPTVAPRV